MGSILDKKAISLFDFDAHLWAQNTKTFTHESNCIAVIWIDRDTDMSTTMRPEAMSGTTGNPSAICSCRECSHMIDSA